MHMIHHMIRRTELALESFNAASRHSAPIKPPPPGLANHRPDRLRIQGWRPETAEDPDDAAAVSALLPAWVPLAAAKDDTGARHAAALGGEEGAAVDPAAPPDGSACPDDETVPSGTGGSSQQPQDASPAPIAPELRPTFKDADAGPAEAEGAHRGGRHAVLDAPLWPRLVDLDPELPAELLRAGVTVHLVAESRVRPRSNLHPNPAPVTLL